MYDKIDIYKAERINIFEQNLETARKTLSQLKKGKTLIIFAYIVRQTHFLSCSFRGVTEYFPSFI